MFENEKELAEQLISWFHEYPQNISLVNIKEIFQQNLRQFQMLRWNENWNRHALPLFRTEWYPTVVSYAFCCLRYFCLNTFFLYVSVMLKNDCFVVSFDLSLGELWRNGWYLDDEVCIFYTTATNIDSISASSVFQSSNQVCLTWKNLLVYMPKIHLSHKRNDALQNNKEFYQMLRKMKEQHFFPLLNIQRWFLVLREP